MIVFNSTIELTMKQFNEKRRITVRISSSIIVKLLAFEFPVSTNSTSVITLFLGQIPLGKILNPLIPQAIG